jgi:hypothetical protein
MQAEASRQVIDDTESAIAAFAQLIEREVCHGWDSAPSRLDLIGVDLASARRTVLLRWDASSSPFSRLRVVRWVPSLE